MLKTVNFGAIGVSVSNLMEAVSAAREGGFAALDFDIRQVAEIGVDAARSIFTDGDVLPAVFGVPFEWRQEETRWQEGLAGLPSLAHAAQSIGCARCATWIMPASDERAFDENFAFHVARLRPIAEILADHGIAFGLEFVGPKTLRDRFQHPFIYTAEGMLAMGREIGSRVGLLLDAFHWYTSQDDLASLSALKPEQIVYVHINDGAEGRGPDEQIDGDRRLPGATGVIDMVGFLKALQGVGYEGPVACEPFFAGLGELASDADRIQTVKASVDAVFAAAGIP